MFAHMLLMMKLISRQGQAIAELTAALQKMQKENERIRREAMANKNRTTDADKNYSDFKKVGEVKGKKYSDLGNFCPNQTDASSSSASNGNISRRLQRYQQQLVEEDDADNGRKASTPSTRAANLTAAEELANASSQESSFVVVMESDEDNAEDQTDTKHVDNTLFGGGHSMNGDHDENNYDADHYENDNYEDNDDDDDDDVQQLLTNIDDLPILPSEERNNSDNLDAKGGTNEAQQKYINSSKQASPPHPPLQAGSILQSSSREKLHAAFTSTVNHVLDQASSLLSAMKLVISHDAPQISVPPHKEIECISSSSPNPPFLIRLLLLLIIIIISRIMTECAQMR